MQPKHATGSSAAAAGRLVDQALEVQETGGVELVDVAAAQQLGCPRPARAAYLPNRPSRLTLTVAPDAEGVSAAVTFSGKWRRLTALIGAPAVPQGMGNRDTSQLGAVCAA